MGYVPGGEHAGQRARARTRTTRTARRARCSTASATGGPCSWSAALAEGPMRFSELGRRDRGSEPEDAHPDPARPRARRPGHAHGARRGAAAGGVRAHRRRPHAHRAAVRARRLGARAHHRGGRRTPALRRTTRPRSDPSMRVHDDQRRRHHASTGGSAAGEDLEEDRALAHAAAASRPGRSPASPTGSTSRPRPGARPPRRRPRPRAPGARSRAAASLVREPLDAPRGRRARVRRATTSGIPSARSRIANGGPHRSSLGVAGGLLRRQRLVDVRDEHSQRSHASQDARSAAMPRGRSAGPTPGLAGTAVRRGD